MKCNVYVFQDNTYLTTSFGTKYVIKEDRIEELAISGLREENFIAIIMSVEKLNYSGLNYSGSVELEEISLEALMKELPEIFL